MLTFALGFEALSSVPSSAASWVTTLTKALSESNARFVGTRPPWPKSARGSTFTRSSTRLASMSSSVWSRMGTVSLPYPTRSRMT